MVGCIAFCDMCVWPFAPALYIVSMPSGIMTISEVPTRTPAPNNVRMRNWRGESEKESGRMPARNELHSLAVDSWGGKENRGGAGHSRDAHYCAQGEQHEEAVPHGESCTLQVVAGAGDEGCATEMKGEVCRR